MHLGENAVSGGLAEPSSRPVGKPSPQLGDSRDVQAVGGEGFRWHGVECVRGKDEIEDAQTGVAHERQCHQLFPAVPLERNRDVDEVARQAAADKGGHLGADGVLDVEHRADVESDRWLLPTVARQISSLVWSPGCVRALVRARSRASLP
jgi:hypothetical protein